MKNQFVNKIVDKIKQSRHALAQHKKATQILVFVSAFAVIGTIVFGLSRASIPVVSFEPESATLSGGATQINDVAASGGKAIEFQESTPPPAGAITHGEQLTHSLVGYQALGVTQGQLQQVTVGDTRISTWPTRGRPSWIPGTSYVYNNDPNNHGGVVPAGGMTIDGFFVPAGTWVSQFHDFDNGMVVEGDAGGTGWPGIVFRGCRYRGPGTAPGFVADHTAVGNGKMWFLYCDMGGNGAQNSDYNEVPLKIAKLPTVMYRNYISYTTTGIQVNTNNSLVLENFIEKLTYYYGPNPPPGESTDKHINGFTTNGGMANIRIERNKIIAQSPDDAGRTINQTDCISFFQDFGSFPGTGTNDNGTVGYQVKDNYLGGTGYVIYAGMNAGKPASSVQNMVITGNKFTTQWWPNSGSFGTLAAAPVWGSYGNVWNNNTWADGPNAGNSL